MLAMNNMLDMFWLDLEENTERPAVLLVEDSLDALLLAQRALLGLNVEIISARTVESALEFLRYRVPAIVVTDLIFPEKSGFSLLEALRKSARLCAVPAVITSGKRDTEYQDKAIRLGVADYLFKPFAPKTLRERVEAYL